MTLIYQVIGHAVYDNVPTYYGLYVQIFESINKAFFVGARFFSPSSDHITLTLLPVWRRRLDIGEVLWLLLRRYSGL